MPLTSSLGLTALYSPEDNWNESAKLIQLKASIPRFDVSLTAVETEWCFHDFTQMAASVQGFAGMPEKRHLFGGNLEGELFGLGLLAEYAYNQMEQSDDFNEWVVGLNYTFDFQTFVMAEYYHNDMGHM
jgi:hypothetical protein